MCKEWLCMKVNYGVELMSYKIADNPHISGLATILKIFYTPILISPTEVFSQEE